MFLTYRARLTRRGATYTAVPSLPTDIATGTFVLLSDWKGSGPVASLEQCQTAVEELAGRLVSPDNPVQSHLDDRTVSCRLYDLGTTIRGQLAGGALTDVTSFPVGAEPDLSQIKLAMTSDDLLALVDGTLAFPHAWASGRLRLDASFRDLLKLRGLLG